MTELTTLEVKELAALVAAASSVEYLELANLDVDWDAAKIELPFETYESKVSGTVRLCEDGEIKLILNG